MHRDLAVDGMRKQTGLGVIHGETRFIAGRFDTQYFHDRPDARWNNTKKQANNCNSY
jgi:hypothetical protein